MRRKLTFKAPKSTDSQPGALGSPKPKIMDVEEMELAVGKNKHLRLRFRPVLRGRVESLYVVGSGWWVRGIRTDTTYTDLVEVMRRSGRWGVVRSLRRLQHMKRRMCLCRYPSDCTYGQTS